MGDKLKLMSSSLLPVILIGSEPIIVVILVLIFVYRHTEKMISKLESAGLGFFVKATETQQKLGVYILVILKLHLILYIYTHRQNSTQTVSVQGTGLTSQHETVSV